MKTLQLRLLLPAILIALALPLRAESPPPIRLHQGPAPEQLLPGNTLAFFTVPDMNKARALWEGDSMVQLWRDPAMKAFADKFENGFRVNLLVPLEKELGSTLAEYTDLAQGQITLALLDSAPGAAFDPHGLLLVDAGGKADALAKQIAATKAKLAEKAKPHKIQTREGVEFLTIGQKKAAGKAGAAGEVHLCQAGSLLLVGDHLPTLEKMVARQKAGAAAGAGVGENLRFAPRQAAQFADALCYGWVDCEPLVRALVEALSKNLPPPSPENPMAIQPAKIVHALGLNGLKAISLSVRTSPEGGLVEIFLDVPADGRRGLFNLAGAQGDASPPAFVGANVSKFGRWRQDLPRFWNNLTGMANEISPLVGTMIGFFETSVREKNPGFNLQTQLIANLGDDVVLIEQTPRGGSKLEDLLTSNAIFLVGSAKPEAVLQAARVLMGASGQAPQTSEVEGRTIHSFGGTGAEAGDKPQGGIHLVSTGSHLAIATDLAALQTYLKGPKEASKALKDLPGLAEAAQKVGGMNTGSFGYENQREVVRGLWQTLQKNPDLIKNFSGLGGAVKKVGADLAWIDLAALPPFEKVDRYFHFWVYAVKTSPEGFQIRYYGPTPPALLKK